MYMTMKELAKLANVSVSTVSKAFSGAEDVSDETKAHIFAVANEYGCYGMFYKGKYQKPIIAIIYPEILSQYYTQFINYLSHLIEEGGGICVTATDNFNKETQAELVEYFISYLKVDGIIALPLRNKLKKAYDTPIVSLFSSADDRVDLVHNNVNQAVKAAAQLLIDYGHRSIAFLGENLTTLKEEAVQAALQQHGIDLTVIRSSARFEKAGKDGVRQLLESGQPFTALVCAYDNIAYGAIKELKKHGLRVPEDVSIIGMDNNIVSGYTETSLTSIDFNPEGACQSAWELLQKKLRNPYFKAPQTIQLKSSLVIRESVRRIEK